MSGGGPAADANGNIYFATGNGTWTTARRDYGDSIVKLGPPSNGSFPVSTISRPITRARSMRETSMSPAGGLVLLPTLPSGQQLLAQQGKQGTIYLLNANNLGKYCRNFTPACTNSDPQIVQEIMGASPGIWGSPAYWNGNLYWTGANDNIKAYSFNANNSGLISTTPTSKSAQIFRILRAYARHFLERQHERHSLGVGWQRGRLDLRWRHVRAASDSLPTMRPISRICSTSAAKPRTIATLRASR